MPDARSGATARSGPVPLRRGKAEPRCTRGGQLRYSALAITTALTLRAVFRLWAAIAFEWWVQRLGWREQVSATIGSIDGR